jgi:hypothetical protein
MRYFVWHVLRQRWQEIAYYQYASYLMRIEIADMFGKRCNVRLMRVKGAWTPRNAILFA